jgi:hypothetical protein
MIKPATNLHVMFGSSHCQLTSSFVAEFSSTVRGSMRRAVGEHSGHRSTGRSAALAAGVEEQHHAVAEYLTSL